MKRLFTFLILFLIPLSACAPIPLSSNVYAANPADSTAGNSASRGSNCSINSVKPIANRKVGTVPFQIELRPYETNGTLTRAKGTIESWQNVKSGPLQPISINSALIKLEAAGRRISATDGFARTEGGKGRNYRIDAASFSFPLPAQGADNVRMVFQRGAIKVGGKTIDFAPIRFSQKQMTSVYLFPCIPS